MRIAVAGIWAECSELSQITLTTNDFFLEEGKALSERWQSYLPRGASSVEFVPLSTYRALPGGFLRASSYADMRDDILVKLKKEMPNLDALLLELHGALGVGGLVDPEAYFLSEIRDLVGSDLVIGCAMDPHGSVSDDLFSLTDVITCNRKSPHVDDADVRRRLIVKVMRALEEGKPMKCKYSLNAVFSGEMTSTDLSPAKEIWGGLADEAASVDLFVGYPWSSDERHMTSCVAYGDVDYLDTDCAKEVVKKVHAARNEFNFESRLLTLPIHSSFFDDEDKLPIFLSDVSDNTGAGSEGSSTVILDGIYRTLYDDSLTGFAGPICGFEDLSGYEVGDPIRVSPCFVGKVQGKFRNLDGTYSLVVHSNGFWVLVSEGRTQLSEKEDFERFGLDLEKFDVVILKMGYLEPYPKSLAKTHRLVLGPGSVNPNLFEVQKLLGVSGNDIWVPGKRGVEPKLSLCCG